MLRMEVSFGNAAIGTRLKEKSRRCVFQKACLHVLSFLGNWFSHQKKLFAISLYFKKYSFMDKK